MCIINGCDGKVVGRGWCRKHYMRWWTHGDPHTARPFEWRSAYCTIKGCSGRHVAKGFCDKHYRRLRRRNSTHDIPKPSAEERFYSHIISSGDCLEWTSTISGNGYGYFRYNGKAHRAHRIAWEWMNGPIPRGWHTHHVCGNKTCVNPDHLEIMPKAKHIKLHRGEKHWRL